MLVPVQGGVANLQKRNRQIFEQQAALSTVVVPDVYIFNVGPREWRGIGGGKSYVIPPCPKGREYSDPVAISALCMSEIDHADGGGNMGVIIDAGMSGTRKVGDELRTVIGVANDVIGTSSTSPACELTTTNGEWFGLFVTANEVPTDEELDLARSKWRQMAEMIYAQGSEIVEQKMPENPIGGLRMQERKLYNEAANALGYKHLWGEGNVALEECPECHEAIKPGAKFCKHCQQAIDPASVAARDKKRARDAAKLLKDENEEAASA
jgi:hypothetical protein